MRRSHSLSASERAVRDALADLLQRWPTRGFGDFETLREWATDSLTARDDAAADAWALIAARLADPQLADPYLMAAGWLTRTRPFTPEQIEHDTGRDIQSVPGSLTSWSGGAPTKADFHVIAAACLEQTEEWSRKAARNPANAFRISQNGFTPRTRAVAEHLMWAVEEWFETDGTRENQPPLAAPVTGASPDTLPSIGVAKVAQSEARAISTELVLQSTPIAPVAKRRRRWPIIAALAAATCLGIVAFVAAWPKLTSPEEAVPPAPEVSDSEAAPASAPDVPANYAQVPIDEDCPTIRSRDGVGLFAVARLDGCWTTSLSVDADEVIYAIVSYKALDETQEDDVTAVLDLPAGIELVSGTTYWGNWTSATGQFDGEDAIDDVGINVGSYAAGANAWWLFMLQVVDGDQFGCGSVPLQASVRSWTQGVGHLHELETRVATSICAAE